MMSELFQNIIASVVDGEPEITEDLTKRAIEAGLEPMAIIDQGLIPGMDIVGKKFESGEYFLPNLIFSAKAMQASMIILEPELHARNQERKVAGKVVIGTVQGDIHEIGKSLVATMLAANSFQVHDLGVDVKPEVFVQKVMETGSNLVGLSALLTTTMPVQKDVILALQEAGLRDKVKVMVGGAPVTRSWADEIGADGFAEDAIGAVAVAKSLCKE